MQTKEKLCQEKEIFLREKEELIINSQMKVESILVKSEAAHNQILDSEKENILRQFELEKRQLLEEISDLETKNKKLNDNSNAQKEKFAILQGENLGIKSNLFELEGEYSLKMSQLKKNYEEEENFLKKSLNCKSDNIFSKFQMEKTKNFRLEDENNFLRRNNQELLQERKEIILTFEKKIRNLENQIMMEKENNKFMCINNQNHPLRESYNHRDSFNNRDSFIEAPPRFCPIERAHFFNSSPIKRISHPQITIEKDPLSNKVLKRCKEIIKEF